MEHNFNFSNSFLTTALIGFIGFVKAHSPIVLRRPVFGNTSNRLFEAEYRSQREILEHGTLMSTADLKGIITYVNDKFCEVSKYSREELIGQPHNIVRHPDMPKHVFREMWNTIGSGKVWQGELKNKAKDGSTYWVYATVSPVLDEHGKPIKYISMRQDITEQKLMQEQLPAQYSNQEVELFQNVNYARNIHHAFLTPDHVVEDIFPESMLIYRAQNIVSGDFYSVQRQQNESLVILGDSTGHGVSASYISIMILNILSQLLKTNNDCPGTILETLHNEMLNATNADENEPMIESADMGFCRINHDTLSMEYSMAKMRGILIREGQVIELERDHYSIGEHMSKTIRLETYQLSLMKGDLLYLFSDGIIDQLGGERDKKFGTRKLIQLLQNYHHFPMKEQKQLILGNLLNWKGNNEQTDDMSLLGFRID